MSDSSSKLPESFLNLNLSEIVRGKAISALAEQWIGQQIDSYRVESLIGSGAHGLVFRACRTEPYHETVAIKLFPSLKGLARGLVRFREECQVLADLDHQNIARILNAGLTDDETPYLVMPLVAGIAIDDYVEQNGCDDQQMAELVRQLVSAVAFAHEGNVVHCDLKPDNILVDENGTVTVTDFGLAIRVDRMQELTQRPSWAPGTVGYCAPEILVSRENASPAVDIYSAGAVLYKLMTGKTPTRDEGWLEAIVNTVARDPEPVLALNPAVPPVLAEICERCLARDPQKRFESAAELESAFATFLRRSTPPQDSSPWLRRTMTLAVIAVTFLGTAAITAFHLSRPTPVAPQSAAPQPVAGIDEPLADDEPLPDEEVARVLDRIKGEFLRPGAKDPAEPGDFDAIFRSLKEAAAELAALLEQAPDNKQVREQAAVGYFLLGRAAHWVDEAEYADASLARSEEMFRRLHRDYPDDGYMFDFFHTIIVQSTRASVRERRDLLLLALGVIEGLSQSSEDNLDYKDALACTWSLLALGYATEESELFDIEKAEPFARKAFDLATQTSNTPGSKPIHRKHIMSSASILGEIARIQGAFEQSLEFAETAHVEAIRLDNALNVADTKSHLYETTCKYIIALRHVGRLDETDRHMRDAARLAEELIELNWPNASLYPGHLKELQQWIDDLRKQRNDCGTTSRHGRGKAAVEAECRF